MSLRAIMPSLSIAGIMTTSTSFDITQCATDCSR